MNRSKRCGGRLQKMTEHSHLLVELTRDKKATVEAIAHRRGVSVQELMDKLLDQFVATEENAVPSLHKVVAALRAHEDELRKRGIRQLYVFGSVARGSAQPSSDIDILVDFEPTVRVSLVTLGSLTAYLTAVLGHAVDVGDRASFRPEILNSIDQDAVAVFR